MHRLCSAPTRWARVLLLTVASLLASCGGGSGGAEDPVPPNNVPVARVTGDAAVFVGDAVVVDGTGSSDADGDVLSFAWTWSERPAGSAATLSGAATSRPGFTPDQPGRYVVRLTVSDGKSTSAAANLALDATLAPAPTIRIDSAEPLAGDVRLSLDGRVGGTVEWFVNLVRLGSGSAGVGSPLVWRTSSVANGSHLLLARIQTSPGVFQEVRRTVEVGNPTIGLAATVSGTSGLIRVDVSATSGSGISQVTARFDGADAGTLTVPNACSSSCIGGNDLYRFLVDGGAVGSGPHTMVITATDGTGATRSITVSVPVANLPVLELAAPVDGSFVSGSLRIEGRAQTDRGGGLTVVAYLGDVEIFRTTSVDPFAGVYDLTGLAPGSYRLRVNAIDATGLGGSVERTVVVSGPTSPTHVPVMLLPDGGQLLATEATLLLYAAAPGDVRLRDLLSATEVQLSGPALLTAATQWQISGGRVYAQSTGADCTGGPSCIYEWQVDGRSRNLSAGNPFAGTSAQQQPVARDGHVLWTNWLGAGSVGSHTLFEVATGQYRQIVPPAGVGYVGNIAYGFGLSGGVVVATLWGQTGGSGESTTFDVYRWRADTGLSVRLTGGGQREVYADANDERSAWQQTLPGGGLFALRSALHAGTSVETLTSRARRFVLGDGFIAWTDASGTTEAVKALRSGSATADTVAANGSVFSASGRRLVWGGSAGLYVWSADTGVSTLQLHVGPSQLVFGQGSMVFLIGRSVYRVAL